MPVSPSPQCKDQRHPCKQYGAGAVEFSIVAVPVLLVGLGAIESAQWLHTRQATSLALLEAGRAGITQHASPQAMIDAFEHALLPLHASGTQGAARGKLDKALSDRQERLGSAPWKIEILSPSSGAYRDFSDAGLLVSRQSGHAAINNAYLHEQYLRHREQGWPEGRGPESGLNVFQANTLSLRLSYLHEPAIPGMKSLLSMLGHEAGTYRQRALAAGYLPIVRTISLVMQSDPVNWPMPDSGKVVGPDPMTSQASTSVSQCAGMWCIKPAPLAAFNSGSVTGPSGPAPGVWPYDPALPKADGPGTLTPGSPLPPHPPYADPPLPYDPLPSCV